MNKQVIVAGGGASGLFAAINIAKKGFDVTVLDANDKPGKKILSTGNGKCNISNITADNTRTLSSKYFCKDTSFAEKIFNVFSNNDVIAAFNSMGLQLKNKNGYLYPASMQAGTVVDVLISNARLNGVKILSNYVLKDFDSNSDGSFTLKCIDRTDTLAPHPINLKCDKLIISVGSKAGLINDYSEALIENIHKKGHNIRNYMPSLCSLYVDKKKFSKDFFKNTSGVRTEIKAQLLIDNNVLQQSEGELQLTDYGLSGIVIFQLSSMTSQEITKGNKVNIGIDFLPAESAEQIADKIMSQDFYSKKSVLDIMSGLLNRKLATELVNLYTENINHNIRLFTKNIDMSSLLSLIKYVKNVVFPIRHTNDFIHSQVCAGGVDIEQINPLTMESKIIKGLYFTGECIDVDGECGGYNLQWAWSTGFVAGRNIE